MRIMSIFLASIAIIGAACGAPPVPQPQPQPPIANDPSGPIADADADPVAVLRALAQAARSDDAVALDALVHPELGLWLWHQPGAAVSPLLQIRAGNRLRPSHVLATAGVSLYWEKNYWQTLADGVDRGLAALDREPADRNLAIYGDCGADDATGGTNLRAWLVATDDLADYAMVLEDSGVSLDPRAVNKLVHFHAWGLDVYLARDGDRWWVAHAMVWTPCEA